MLILTRRAGERIRVGADTWITITHIGSNQVKIGFEVPDDVHVIREELIGKAPVGRVLVSAPQGGVRVGNKGT